MILKFFFENSQYLPLGIPDPYVRANSYSQIFVCLKISIINTGMLVLISKFNFKRLAST